MNGTCLTTHCRCLMQFSISLPLMGLHNSSKSLSTTPPMIICQPLHMQIARQDRALKGVMYASLGAFVPSNSCHHKAADTINDAKQLEPASMLANRGDLEHAIFCAWCFLIHCQ